MTARFMDKKERRSHAGRRPRKSKTSLEYRKRRAGYLFLLPWFIGLVMFFLVPLVKTFIYAFEKVELSATGMVTTFIGLENFRYAFFVDPDFLRQCVDSLQNLIQVPLVLVYALFFAYMIKDSFRGRTFMRAIAFLPVVVGSGVIITILKEDVIAQGARSGQSVYLFSSGGIAGLLVEIGLGGGLISFVTDIMDRIFDMTWKSGVQILLFLAGLHGIPGDVYEVSSIEGARKWEQFWKLTLPMLTPVIFVNLVYTLIDSFMDYGNYMVRMLYDTTFKQLRFGYSSAMSIVYFIMVSVVLGIVYLVLRKRIVYADE